MQLEKYFCICRRILSYSRLVGAKTFNSRIVIELYRVYVMHVEILFIARDTTRSF